MDMSEEQFEAVLNRYEDGELTEAEAKAELIARGAGPEFADECLAIARGEGDVREGK